MFLEAESGKIIEETFDSLIKSDLAVHSLKQLKSKNLREVRTCSTLNILSPSLNQVIGKKYMKKVDCIISKFSKEIDAADELFETKCDDPPVEDSLPPISGSIYWSQGIGQFQHCRNFLELFQSSFVTGAELKSTLEQLESLEEIVQFSSWPDIRKKLEVVLKRLESYEVGKYTDWRNKVSDILDQNLGKHLIRREDASDREEGEEEQSKVGRFVVNFTSDLSDTFAEVIAF